MEYLIFDTQNCKRKEKKEKSHECHNTKEQNTNNEKYIHKKTSKNKLIKKKAKCPVQFFFCVCVPRGTFFFFKQNVTEKKVHKPRRWHTELAVYFRGVVWVFFGSSGIYSSSWWFSEVVGEITHVAEENKIGVGWVKVKVTYFVS